MKKSKASEKQKPSPLERMCRLVDEVNRRLYAYDKQAECFCGRRPTEEPVVDDCVLEFIEHAVDTCIDSVISKRRKHGHGRDGSGT